MRLNANRESLLPLLKTAAGIVEKKQTLAILGNILLDASDSRILLRATDSEIDIEGAVDADIEISGRTTVPADKFLDIVRNLPVNANIRIEEKESRIEIKSGRTRFALGFLPADDYPANESFEQITEIAIESSKLKKAVAETQKAMANQDVRFYLNGMLFDISSIGANIVATDGHRLSAVEDAFDAGDSADMQVIVPRKAVLELFKAIPDSEDEIKILIAERQIRFVLPDFTITSKLIDGKFPDYEAVIPKNAAATATANRAELINALNRVSVLSGEYRGVVFDFNPGALRIYARNPEQEESEDEIDIAYQGDRFETGFNVSYVLDALAAIQSDEIRIEIGGTNGSGVFLPSDNDLNKHVVMPMRI